MRQSYRKRRIQDPPQFTNFKPSGIPRRLLDSVEMTVDEFEAIRLADFLQKDHLQASEEMRISRPTFTRLIEKARQKVASALIEGKELAIAGGNIDFVNTMHRCHDCGHTSRHRFGAKHRDCCDCGSENIEDLASSVTGRKKSHKRKNNRENKPITQNPND